jgi:hypothetical protein
MKALSCGVFYYSIDNMKAPFSKKEKILKPHFLKKNTKKQKKINLINVPLIS